MQISENETIGLHFFTRRSINNRAIGRTFFDILRQQFPYLLPTEVDMGKGWRKLDFSDLDSVFICFETQKTLLFRNINDLQTEIALSLVDINSGFKTITFWVEESFFEQQQNVDLYLDTCIEIYSLFQPDYGFVHQTSDKLKMATISEDGFETVLPIKLNKGLPGIYWCNLFGPNYVELLGEKLLLSTPCCEVKKLTNGGIMIITSSSPLMPNVEENRDIQGKIKLHLGKGNFWPQILY